MSGTKVIEACNTLFQAATKVVNDINYDYCSEYSSNEIQQCFAVCRKILEMEALVWKHETTLVGVALLEKLISLIGKFSDDCVKDFEQSPRSNTGLDNTAEEERILVLAGILNFSSHLIETYHELILRNELTFEGLGSVMETLFGLMILAVGNLKWQRIITSGSEFLIKVQQILPSHEREDVVKKRTIEFTRFLDTLSFDFNQNQSQHILEISRFLLAYAEGFPVSRNCLVQWICNYFSQEANPCPKFLFLLIINDSSQLKLIKNGMNTLRSSLASDNAKMASFCMKLLISEKNELIIGNLAEEVSTKFWSSYFELLDILEEKQSHLIEPVISKNFWIFDSKNYALPHRVEVARWELVVLQKMIYHDNRNVVKLGVTSFISDTIAIYKDFENSKDTSMISYEEDLKIFLRTHLIPIIKQHIAWMFPEPKNYLNTSKLYGEFLFYMYTKKGGSPWDWLFESSKDGKSFSPAAAYFFVLSCYTACMLNSNLCYMNFKSASIFLDSSLTAIDKFLKFEIQSMFLRTVNAIYSNDSNRMSCRDDIVSGLALVGKLELKILERYPIEWEKFRGVVIEEIYKKSTSEEICDLVSCDPWIGNGFLRSIFFYNYDEFSKLVELLVNTRLSLINNFSCGLQELLPKALQLDCSLDNVIRSLEIGAGRFLDKLVSKFEENDSSKTGSSEDMLELVQEFEASVAFPSTVTAFQAISCSDSNLCNELASKKLIKRLANCDTQCDLILLPLVEIVVWKLPLIFNICDTEDLSIFYQLFIHEAVSLKSKSPIVNSYKVSTGKDILSELIKTRFTAFGVLLNCSSDKSCSIVYDPKKLISTILQNTEASGYCGIIYSLKFMLIFLRFMRNFIHVIADDLEDYLTLAWKLVLEMRKNEEFWDGMELFLDVLMTCAVPNRLHLIEKFAELIFEIGDNVPGISYVLIRAIYPICGENELITAMKSNPDFLETVINVAVKACYFSPGITKNAKFAFDLWDYLNRIELEESKSMLNLSANISREDIPRFAWMTQARLLAVKILQNVLQVEMIILLHDETSRTGENATQERDEFKSLKILFTPKIVMRLLNPLNEDKAKRYFGNSVIHRKKLRILQAIISVTNCGILSADLTETKYIHVVRKLKIHIIEETLQMLVEDNPQPSTRYFAEWIIVLVILNSIYQDQEIVQKFYTLALKGLDKRTGFGAIFSSILLNTIKGIYCQNDCIVKGRQDQSNDALISGFLKSALQYLATMCFHSHVTVRAYSQTCFLTIFEKIKSNEGDEKEISEFIRGYDILYNSLNEANMTSSGTFKKVLDGIKNDFFIQKFHPVSHLHPLVVFVFLPVLSEVAMDEIPFETEPELLSMRYRRPKYLLGEIKAQEIQRAYSHIESVWHLKSTPVEGRELGEEFPTSVDFNSSYKECSQLSSTTFQRKINPWKILSVSDLEVQNFKYGCLQRHRNPDGLIVVASLVDKLPNLGGLCRSCEIFGVAKFVVPSLKILTDQQFQSVSVSAHNWVDIMEVPARDLETFLISYSKKGYTILGIEQTPDAEKLNNYKFPKSSVLVLGNEKMGIPSNLLHLVQKCVEIPQVGIIRSLNVHVSGALCMWQYASQHLF